MILLMKLDTRGTFAPPPGAESQFFRARFAHIVQTGSAVESEEAPELTMVCAWCDRVLVVGTSGEISHGICDECMPGVVKEILERLELEKQGQADEDGAEGEGPEFQGQTEP